MSGQAGTEPPRINNVRGDHAANRVTSLSPLFLSAVLSAREV
jgi:hypothetical protein